MDDKDLQHLALVIMQLHIQIGRLQQQNNDLQKQIAKKKGKEARDGVV